jgi:hypothetical protein
MPKLRGTRRVEEARCTVDFPWLYPPFPASCPFRSIMAHRGLLPHRPHRADFPQRVRQAHSPPRLRILSWFGVDNRSSFGDIDIEFKVSIMFPSPDTSARATPSLQWVPWPPLAGALRFPTFVGIMGFYDCSRSIRAPPVDPRSHVPPLRRRSGALFGSWTIPVKTCPGLGTPATPARPRNSGRCPDIAFR